MQPERIERVEERMAWLERHVTEQDKAMLEMSREIDRLRDELRRLTERGSAGGGLEGNASTAGLDDRPPHY